MWPQQTDTQKITTWYHWRRTLNLKRKKKLQQHTGESKNGGREREKKTKEEKKKSWVGREWDSSGLISSIYPPGIHKSCRRRCFILLFFSSLALRAFIDVGWLWPRSTEPEEEKLKNSSSTKASIESNCCFAISSRSLSRLSVRSGRV